MYTYIHTYVYIYNIRRASCEPSPVGPLVGVSRASRRLLALASFWWTTAECRIYVYIYIYIYIVCIIIHVYIYIYIYIYIYVSQI